MPGRWLLFALNDHNEAVYLSDGRSRGFELCNICSEVLTFLRHWLGGAPCSDAPKAGVLLLSVFGVLFVRAVRIIPGHPVSQPSGKSAEKDTF